MLTISFRYKGIENTFIQVIDVLTSIHDPLHTTSKHDNFHSRFFTRTFFIYFSVIICKWMVIIHLQITHYGAARIDIVDVINSRIRGKLCRPIHDGIADHLHGAQQVLRLNLRNCLWTLDVFFLQKTFKETSRDRENNSDERSLS